jgi:predicted lipoprotein with Yx(FWY)xxD motif
MKLMLALVAAAVLAPAAAGASGPVLTAHSSSYGRAVFDNRGYVLYAFTRDHKRSACYGECAKRWPPYLARKRTLRVGKGLKASLLGTVKRRNGRRQVTYAGRPLYFYVGDTGPGVIRCQNAVEFGGRWLLVRPSGKLLR